MKGRLDAAAYTKLTNGFKLTMIDSEVLQKLNAKVATIAIVLTMLFLSATATAQTQEAEDHHFWDAWNAYIIELVEQELSAPDPWEPLNRKVFAFNDFVDRYTLTPIAKTYQFVTPDPLEAGIGNMFSNLTEVTTIINDLLQLKFGQAASDTGRFLLNSTVGLLGLFDVATPIGLEKHQEDFGQTLGYWGMGSGPYIVLPILGSYTVRDGLGSYPDNYSDYLKHLDHVSSRNQWQFLRIIDVRTSLFSAEELIAGDRYTFIRDAYLQRREYLVNDGLIVDSFGDEDWDMELD